MMASTHAAIGVVLGAGAVALAGGEISAPVLAVAAVASWLPDIDTPTSRAGFCVYPLAAFLEKKFGHRTVTHSALGVAAFALLCSPLLLWPSGRVLFVAAVVGYFSHLLADAATKSGVPMAWPRRERWVVPGNMDHRVTTGSAAEMGVFVVFVLLGLATLGMVRAGPRQLLHALTGDIRGAVRDVQDWQADWNLTAEVDGFDVRTGRVISGRWPVVGLRGDDGVLMSVPKSETDQATLVLVSNTATETERIAPRHIRIFKAGRRGDIVETRRVANITLAALGRAILETFPLPTSETLSGEKDAPDPTAYIVSGEGECFPFPSGTGGPSRAPLSGIPQVFFAGQHITFDHAPAGLISSAGARVALKTATLTISRPAGSGPLDLTTPRARLDVQAVHLRRQADLHVKPGDLVRRGSALGQTFGQTIEDDGDRARRAAASADLQTLAVEIAALKTSALWPSLRPRYVARRAALVAIANAKPAAAPTPPLAVAPFDAVIEAIVWEPPTVSRRPGEVAEMAATVTLDQVRHTLPGGEK